MTEHVLQLVHRRAVFLSILINEYPKSVASGRIDFWNVRDKITYIRQYTALKLRPLCLRLAGSGSPTHEPLHTSNSMSWISQLRVLLFAWFFNLFLFDILYSERTFNTLFIHDHKCCFSFLKLNTYDNAYQ